MAERTGIAKLDVLLARWQAGAFRSYGDLLNKHTDPVEWLREETFARQRCILVSEQLVAFLRSSGLDLPGREAYVSGDEWDGDVMVIERISPEDFGYQDRTIEGCNSHQVCMIDWDGQRFMVDFTCAQYGYQEFPMVQRLVGGGGWEREFAGGERKDAAVLAAAG